MGFLQRKQAPRKCWRRPSSTKKNLGDGISISVSRLFITRPPVGDRPCCWPWEGRWPRRLLMATVVQAEGVETRGGNWRQRSRIHWLVGNSLCWVIRTWPSYSTYGTENKRMAACGVLILHEIARLSCLSCPLYCCRSKLLRLVFEWGQSQTWWMWWDSSRLTLTVCVTKSCSQSWEDILEYVSDPSYYFKPL